jgi:sugar lactone lactonase YvrE
VDGRAVPYPDEAFQENFHNVLGMFIDSQNRLWTLDNASLDPTSTRLLAFDLSTDTVVHDHTFADGFDFLNDLQVSPDGQTIYFSDPGLFILQEPSLVVYDIASETSRRLLQGHDSVSSQDWMVRTSSGTMWFMRELILFQLGVDGIALSKDGKWLYYGGITNDTLYRVATADLLATDLSPEELGNRLEAVSRKPLSDGFSIDLEDNLYITDVEHQGLSRMTPDGRLKTLVRDDRVRWADGISFGPDGWVYFTDSALNAIAGFLPMASPEKVENNAPYHLFRFRSDVAGIPGG